MSHRGREGLSPLREVHTMRRMVEGHRLTKAEETLWKALQGRPLTSQTEMATRLDLSRKTICRGIRRLRELGLVK